MNVHWLHGQGRRGRNRIVVGFTTTCATSTYHHQRCEFKSRSWRGEPDTTLCDKVCQRLATGWWFSQGTAVSSTNKTDCHDITEILFENGIKHHNPKLTYFYTIIAYNHLNVVS